LVIDNPTPATQSDHEVVMTRGFIGCALGVMLLGFGRVIIEPVAWAGQPSPPELMITLRDGSRLRGQPSLSAFPIQTGFGEMRVPIDAVVSIRFGEERGKAVACFMNGDQITGTLELPSLPLKTLLGEISISLDQIAELAVLARGMTADGLVLYYPFDSDKADEVADRSGNNLHGTVHGRPQFVTGVAGKALQLGDGADWISVPQDNKLDLKGEVLDYRAGLWFADPVVWRSATRTRSVLASVVAQPQMRVPH
jgi:hypothetical protein